MRGSFCGPQRCVQSSLSLLGVSSLTRSYAQAVAFVLGFALQNLKVTFAIFTLGFLGCLAVRLPVLALPDIAHTLNEQVTLPPLPAYNAHPVKWLDPLDEYGERKSAVVAGGSPGAIEGKKDR